MAAMSTSMVVFPMVMFTRDGFAREAFALAFGAVQFHSEARMHCAFAAHQR